MTDVAVLLRRVAKPGDVIRVKSMCGGKGDYVHVRVTHITRQGGFSFTALPNADASGQRLISGYHGYMREALYASLYPIAAVGVSV